MAEVILAAEIGRPSGSRATRRLRREGKIPGVDLRARDRPGPGGRRRPRAPRRPQQRGRGPTSCSRSRRATSTYLALAREMQRHPVRATVTHVDFQIVRRDEVIAPTSRSSCRVRRSRCTTATAWSTSRCSPWPSTALPADIPTAIEVDISDLVIGGQLAGLRPHAAGRRDHRRGPRVGVAIGQPRRVVTVEERLPRPRGEEGAEGGRRRRGRPGDASAEAGSEES